MPTYTLTVNREQVEKALEKDRKPPRTACEAGGQKLLQMLAQLARCK